MRRAIISSPWRWPITRCVQRVGELEDGLDLVLHHAADRDAGPVGDDRRHRLRIDAGQDQRRLALQRLELRLLLVQLGEQLFAIDRRSAHGRRLSVVAAPAVAASTGLSSPRSCARSASTLSTITFSSCQRFRGRPGARARARASRRRRCGACRSSTPTAGSRPMMPELGLQRLDAAAAVLHLGRRRVLADRDARAGRVEQADRLVGQLARRGCSGATA